jgi:hypothetical protein
MVQGGVFMQSLVHLGKEKRPWPCPLAFPLYLHSFPVVVLAGFPSSCPVLDSHGLNWDTKRNFHASPMDSSRALSSGTKLGLDAVLWLYTVLCLLPTMTFLLWPPCGGLQMTGPYCKFISFSSSSCTQPLLPPQPPRAGGSLLAGRELSPSLHCTYGLIHLSSPLPAFS